MANQHESDLTLSKILNKLLKYFEENMGLTRSEESIPFKYDNFKKIMMRENMKPVISFERTLRQKYKDLIICEFLSGGMELSRFYTCKAYDYVDEYGGLE